ncbi:RNA-binding cell elongation regulator Jag/EloR [Pseudogracilibacillus auburnensis]|uniref:RNA-binding protein KhpB n=1 Tax=Pseudogracilibacillus auburnensis TaxID=1494959 RepID=A0A2V3VRW0_9BACI|nr:RNA-binding cell elongation regulator Jag/EloR [Pseudogracilibacillus auburnensis]MBO1004169.1 protein jag [Pseudogracilibacillus auburnensis]PXW83591.1 spoIIIJ-associated protein [Pseudogracilibacillus auburnensis]
MREVTASGQTVEEAIQSALEQLNITRDQVEIEVIDEGKKGFLGIFGSARAVVKVKEKKDNISEAEAFLTNVAKNMGVDVTVTSMKEDNHVNFHLQGDKIAILIGKRGKTLNSLQYLTQLVLNKSGGQFHSVTVDAEGYRERRKETLVDLAHKMADKAGRINRKVALEPMPAYERKIIHSTLQELTGVTTYSEGVEPHRHVVIKPS